MPSGASRIVPLSASACGARAQVLAQFGGVVDARRTCRRRCSESLARGADCRRRASSGGSREHIVEARASYNRRMFVHLRLHTEFSVVDGTNRIDEVVKAAAKPTASPRWRSPTSTTSSAPSSSTRKRAARASSRCWAPRSSCEGLGAEPGALTRIVLLVQNKQGYLNLSRTAGARLDAERRPRPGAGRLQAGLAARSCSGGLIALSGAQAGPLGQPLLQGDRPSARPKSRCSWPACSRTASTSSCSAPAAPTTSRTSSPPCNSPRGCKLPVVATHPVQFADGRRLRGARGARVHLRRRDPGQPAPRAQVHARAVLQVVRRDGGAVRRRARAPSPTRSRSPSAAT